MATTAQQIVNEKPVPGWEGFNVGLWQNEINVRDFIQQNYEPYEEDDSFLAGPTERTTKIWGRLNELFIEERKKGVLDISQIPGAITSHGPGYIDQPNEVIVGLQTDAPLKRSIMPNGGLRMVLTALKTWLQSLITHRRSIHEISKTHNEESLMHRRHQALSVPIF